MPGKQDSAPLVRISAALALPAAVSAFAVIVFFTGWLSVQLAFPGNLSPLWLPSGVGVAVVLWRGPWFFVGLWVGGALADFAGGFSPLVSMLLELGSVTEVALVVLVIRRWGGGLEGSATLRGTLALLGASALVGCPVGATVGGFVMSLFSPEPAAVFAGHWIVWWLGDTSGILLVAPALLRWHQSERSRVKTPRPAWWLVFFGILALVTAALFFRSWGGSTEEVGHALTYLSFPFVAVAGLWLGTMGVTATVGLTTALALAGTFCGSGPFVAAPVMTSVLLLQVYAIAMAVTGHVLAAVRLERERALQAMARSTERLMAAERLAGIGWWQVDESSGERAWSDGMFHVLGAEPGSEAPGRNSLDLLVDPADRELLERYRAALLPLADGEGIEFRVRRPDGAERWLVCRHTVAPDSGSVFFGIVKDITDQKRQTLALHESERTLRRVFDQSPIGISIVSLDFRFLKVNEALCRLTGYSSEELLSHGVADITHPEDVVKSFAGVPAMLAGEYAAVATSSAFPQIRTDCSTGVEKV